MLVVNSLCKNIFLIFFFRKFPVFSLSGKMDFQIPCFPCAVATLKKKENIAENLKLTAASNPVGPLKLSTQPCMNNFLIN